MRRSAAYLGSTTLSVLGNSITAVILPLLVLQVTGSVISAGVMALAVGIPQFVAAAAGGVLVDRFSRKSVAIAGDIASAIAVAALPLIDATLGLSVGWFIVFGILSAVGDVPAMTAREAMVPAVAKLSGTSAERLLGMRDALAAIATLAGPALAGLLLIFSTPSMALWITAATSMLAAIVTFSLPVEVGQAERLPSADRSQPWADFIQGIRYLLGHNATLRMVTVLGLVLVVAAGAIQGIVLPAYFTETGQPGNTGMTLSLLAVGMAIGAGVYAGICHVTNARAVTAAGAVFAAVGVWLLAGFFGLPAILVAVCLLGIGIGLLSAQFGALTLRLASTTMHGRVLGNQNALTMGLAPFAILGTAVLIHTWSVQNAVVAIAIVLTVSLMWAVFVQPRVSTRPEALDQRTSEVNNV